MIMADLQSDGKVRGKNKIFRTKTVDQNMDVVYGNVFPRNFSSKQTCVIHPCLWEYVDQAVYGHNKAAAVMPFQSTDIQEKHRVSTFRILKKRKIPQVAGVSPGFGL